MSHRVTIEQAKQRFGDEKGRQGDLTKSERRILQREARQKEWALKMKKRGGMVPRKAKYWGDDCDIKQCERWVDGTCQYPGRDEGKCIMENENEK